MSINEQVYFPYGNNVPAGIVKIKNGGTGCTSVEKAVEKFNAVTKDQLGASFGIASYTENGKILGNQINKVGIKTALSFLTTIYEQNYINVGQTIYFTIEGYDEEIEYNLDANIGTISREGNEITYVAPNTPGLATITFNGKTYNYEIIASELATPRITFPANNQEELSLALTFTSSDFAIQREDAPNSTHSMSSWEVSTSPSFSEGTIVKSVYNNVSSKTSFSVTDLTVATNYYVRVKYRNTNGIWSDWSTATKFKTLVAFINKPTITSPANNTTSISPYGVNVICSDYSVFGSDAATYPHVSTDWQIASDVTFTTLVRSSMNDTVNKTTWSVFDLSKTTTYYLRVRYNTDILGPSEWSNVTQFTTPNYVTDASGRTFYRHQSGMGTVMGWVDKRGIRHETLVLDAPYRAALLWGPISTLVSGMTNYTGSFQLYTTSKEFTSWNTATTEATYPGSSKTDAQINSISKYFEDIGTSRNNTTQMYNLNSSTAYTAGWVRSKTVNHRGKIYKCDLPNIQTLCRIACAQFRLDIMDPTTTHNQNKFSRLGNGSNSNWFKPIADSDCCGWSSTQVNAGNAICLDNSSSIFSYTKNFHMGTVPILELLEIEDL